VNNRILYDQGVVDGFGHVSAVFRLMFPQETAESVD
jgi:hypothetical protein